MDLSDSSRTRFTLPSNANRKKVPGLRDEAPNGEIKVFKLNADGSKGKLLRTEPSYTSPKKLPREMY